MRTLPLIFAGLVASMVAFGQAPAKRVEFEVASVKPSPPLGQGGQVVVGLHMDGSHARIAMAYRVKAYQVNGPDWIGSQRFDVNATLPAGATADQIPEMLQNLLADRFQLKFHREKKEFPVYALVMGKPPLKLKESAVDADSGDRKGLDIAGTGSAAGVSVNLGNGSYYTFADNKFEIRKVNMDILANLLERYLDRPLVNMTDLKGNYDLTLNVTPEDYQALLIRAAVNSGVTLPPQVLRFMDGNSGPSLFDAVQAAGLKLDARKAPLDSIVVDQVLKTPTEN
jgi:uncharacterized protein (TIGR03435 family)